MSARTPSQIERRWRVGEMIAALLRRGGITAAIFRADLEHIEDRVTARDEIDRAEEQSIATTYWMAFGQEFRP